MDKTFQHLLLKRPDSRSYCFFAAKITSASNLCIPTGEYGCTCFVVNRFKALHGPNRRPVSHMIGRCLNMICSNN